MSPIFLLWSISVALPFGDQKNPVIMISTTYTANGRKKTNSLSNIIINEQRTSDNRYYIIRCTYDARRRKNTEGKRNLF